MNHGKGNRTCSLPLQQFRVAREDVFEKMKMNSDWREGSKPGQSTREEHSRQKEEGV